MSFESYGFEIVGSADKANKEIDSTLANLDSIGPRSLRASQQIQTAMDRAAEYVRKFNAALDRPRGQGVTEGALRTAQAYQKLAQQEAAYIEQLQREQHMLEAIHGPMNQAHQDIQTLNSLLAKGAINAHEFNARLATIRAPSAVTGGGGGFDVSSIAGSLPGGGIVAGAIGGGVAGAAAAGIQYASQAAHAAIEMGDAYTSAQNRLKNLTGSTEAAKATYDRLFDSAQKTRSGIDTTTEGFIRITNATKSMGLTQQQVLTFTEHLNMMMAMGGGTAAETAAGMLQLSQAMASGVLRGDEFNSIMENAQPISMALQSHLHKTQGELRAMAEQGQITAKIVYESIEAAGKSTEAAFGSSVPTISAQFVVLKNEIARSVGELMAMADVGKIVGDVTKDLSAIIAASAEQTKLWGEALGMTDLKLSDLGGGGLQGLREIGAFFNDLDLSSDNLGHSLTGTKANLGNVNAASDQLARAVAMGTGRMKEYSQAAAETAIQLTLGENAAIAFTAQTAASSAKLQAAKEVTAAYQDTLGKLTEGIDIASFALGRLGQALNDNATNRAARLVQDRSEQVRQAKLDLDALRQAHDADAHAVVDFATKQRALLDIINGVSSAARTQAKEMKNLARALLGEETPSQRAIRQGKGERDQQATEDEYLGGLDSKAQASASRTYALALDQLNRIEESHMTTASEHAGRVRVLTDEYLKQAGVLELVRGKTNAADEQIRQLGEAYKMGAINADEYARALANVKGSSAQKAAEERTKAWKEELEQYRQAANEKAKAIAGVLTPLSDSLIDGLHDGTLSWKNWGDTAVREIEKAIAKMVILAAIQAATGGTVGGGGGGLASIAMSIFGGGAPGFATGGDFMMGGAGQGSDTHLAMWWMTPGETASIRTPEQRRQAAKNENAGGITITPEIKILPPPERYGIVDDSRRGQTTLAKMERRRGRRD